MTASRQDGFLAFSSNRFCGGKEKPRRETQLALQLPGDWRPNTRDTIQMLSQSITEIPCPHSCSSWYPELDAIARVLDAINEHENGFVFLSNTAVCTRAWETSLQKHLFPFSEEWASSLIPGHPPTQVYSLLSWHSISINLE